MRKIELLTINHNRPAVSPAGGIVESFIVGQDDLLGDNISGRPRYYADWCAHYYVWKNRPDIDIIGFQGRRKLFNFMGCKPGWKAVDPPEFARYQEWLKTWDAKALEDALQSYDILVTEPFDISYNVDMTEDFNRSASPKDWATLVEIMSQHGDFNFRLPYITSHSMFITNASIFRSFMRTWWAIMQELEPRLHVIDANPGAYHVRPMAYLSERVFAIWLDAANLRQKIVPLMICWDAP